MAKNKFSSSRRKFLTRDLPGVAAGATLILAGCSDNPPADGVHRLGSNPDGVKASGYDYGDFDLDVSRAELTDLVYRTQDVPEMYFDSPAELKEMISQYTRLETTAKRQAALKKGYNTKLRDIQMGIDRPYDHSEPEVFPYPQYAERKKYQEKQTEISESFVQTTKVQDELLVKIYNTAVAYKNKVAEIEESLPTYTLAAMQSDRREEIAVQLQEMGNLTYAAATAFQFATKKALQSSEVEEAKGLKQKAYGELWTLDLDPLFDSGRLPGAIAIGEAPSEVKALKFQMGSYTFLMTDIDVTVPELGSRANVEIFDNPPLDKKTGKPSTEENRFYIRFHDVMTDNKTHTLGYFSNKIQEFGGKPL